MASSDTHEQMREAAAEAALACGLIGLMVGIGGTLLVSWAGSHDAAGSSTPQRSAVYASRSLQVGVEGAKADVLRLIAESSLVGRGEHTPPQVSFVPDAPHVLAKFQAKWSSGGTEINSDFALGDVADDMTRRLQADGVIAEGSKSLRYRIDIETGAYDVSWNQPIDLPQAPAPGQPLPAAAAARPALLPQSPTLPAVTDAGPPPETTQEQQQHSPGGATPGPVYPVSPHS